jgi:hypothetical protein
MNPLCRCVTGPRSFVHAMGNGGRTNRGLHGMWTSEVPCCISLHVCNSKLESCHSCMNVCVPQGSVSDESDDLADRVFFSMVRTRPQHAPVNRGEEGASVSSSSCTSHTSLPEDDSAEGAGKWYGEQTAAMSNWKPPLADLTKCAYPRCLDRHSALPDRVFICPQCRRAAYCNEKCRTKHWEDDPPNCHRCECAPYPNHESQWHPPLRFPQLQRRKDWNADMSVPIRYPVRPPKAGCYNYDCQYYDTSDKSFLSHRCAHCNVAVYCSTRCKQLHSNVHQSNCRQLRA